MSFFDDASLVLLSSGAAGKDGKAYSMKPVPEYGNELVTNGGFDTDSDWVKGTGWTISGGTANCDGSSNILRQSNAVPLNTKFYVSIEVSNYVSGTLQVKFAPIGYPLNVTKNGIYTISTNGDNSTNGDLQIISTSFIGSVDNVSVKEITTESGDFTFSRGSNLTATRVDSNGLIEKGRENLLLQSNQFDTTWIPVTASVTSGQSGYDGSSDAWLLSKSAASGRIYQNASVSGVATYSVYAKRNDLDWLFIIGTASSYPEAYFDLLNGTIGNTSSHQNFIGANIEAVGNGWYRCSITFNDSLGQFRIYPADGNNNFSGTSGSIYIQDAQLEQGLVATEYIESGASTGKAGLLENEPRFDYSGGATCPSLLLEPQRVNLFGQSEYFNASTWSSTRLIFEENATISPEGLLNASKMIPSTDNNTHFFYDSVPTTINENYTFSLFVKATPEYNKISILHSTAAGVFNGGESIFNASTGTFDSVAADTTASIESYNNQWYRLILTQESLATANGLVIVRSYDGSSSFFAGNGVDGIYLYGAQMEQGSYPTSYIPNHSGGSVTRLADVCEGAGTSSTFNDSEGVLYAEIAAIADDLTFRSISLSDGTNNNRVIIRYRTTSNAINFLIAAGGSVIRNIQHSVTDITDYHKLAIKYKDRDIGVFVDGAKVATYNDTFTLSSLNEVSFTDGSGSDIFYGKPKQILVFNTALSDSQLIALTS